MKSEAAQTIRESFNAPKTKLQKTSCTTLRAVPVAAKKGSINPDRVKAAGAEAHGTVEEGARRLSRTCALTARSADGTELFGGLPRPCGLDRRLLEAVGMDPDAPLPVVNSNSAMDAGKQLQSRRNSL